MADVIDVAAAIVDEAAASGIDPSLTTKKLQKLVYYAQAWHLAETGYPLFGDPIEAWVDGPVVRRLWDCHRGDFWARRADLGEAGRLSPDERGIVRRIVDRYGRLSADRLIALTHREVPWRAARGDLDETTPSDRPIDVELMGRSYPRYVASPSDAVDLAIASSRLEGLITDRAMLPTLHAVAQGELDVEEAVKTRIAAVRG